VVVMPLCCGNNCASGLSMRTPKPMPELAGLIYLYVYLSVLLLALRPLGVVTFTS
jgi:hypothetical protein